MKYVGTRRAIACLIIVLLLAPAAAADVRLPRIFGDHMVLQGGQKLPVWGWANAGEKVTVKVAGKTARATAAGNGKWKTTLPALKPGGPYEMTVQGKNKVTFKDVLVGEVWMCSGQSNMDIPVGLLKDTAWWKGVLNREEELAKANKPKLRFFKVAPTWKQGPIDDVAGTWEVCTPATTAKFSGSAYFFGSHLLKELKRPVGMIAAAVGGMPIEQFTPNSGQAFWYNGMIAPVVPYGIKGAAWYQGETNMWADSGRNYFDKQKTLIERWRKNWERPKLPFCIVQLAPLQYGNDPTSLPRFWEAQAMTLSLPKTGIVSTMDIGDIKDVHPRNKQGVGKRLALWALAKTYGKDIVYSGPMYKSKKIQGNRIRVHFKHAGSGLESRDGKPLTHFEIAGDAGFVPAEAVIEGKTVVVSSDKVAKPTAVRFAWYDRAQPNLQNKEGLPAYPFRTVSTSPTVAGSRLFGKTAMVTIACAETNGVIRYTRNGRTPTAVSRKYSKPIRVTKTTTIRARFFRKDGPASAVVKTTFTKAKPRKHDGKTLLPGLRYDCYEGSWTSVPDFAKLTPKKSGVAGDFSVAISGLKDNFGLRFTGYVDIKTAGTYTFQTASDDGSKLYVDGKEVVNNDGLHGVVAKTGTIELKPGMHKIVVAFFEAGGGEGLFVKYKGPEIPMQEIPAWCEQ